MNLRGTTRCVICGKENFGVLPDNKGPGKLYMSLDHELSEALIILLREHHDETATELVYSRDLDDPNAEPVLIEKKRGHKYHDVFLEDGGRGTIEATSYVVIYKAPRKK